MILSTRKTKLRWSNKLLKDSKSKILKDKIIVSHYLLIIHI